MIANLLIGLREGLEAALVVSILIAYLVRSDRRHLIPRIWVGVALAIAVSLGFGALLTFGPADLAESSQELIAGTLSVLAVVFVTWMIFWMAGAARGMGAELRSRVDAAAARGGLALVLTALLAVGREGLETALFLWAATRATTTGGPEWQALLGALVGLSLAALIGYLIYRGALRVNLTAFFTWTGAFLILVAAGVLSYAVHDLQEGGLLPGESTLLFDVSAAVPVGSWYGTLLKGIFNFSAATTVLQGIAWLAYVVPAMALFWRKVTRGHPARVAPQPDRQAERTPAP
jgi:high-affinity iron transporter